MTKKEAAILSVHTGILFGKFQCYQEYAEKLLKTPILTHEFSLPEISKELKEKSRTDFIKIMEKLCSKYD